MEFVVTNRLHDAVKSLRLHVAGDFASIDQSLASGDDIWLRDEYRLNCWSSDHGHFHHFKKSDRQTSLVEFNFGMKTRAAIGVEDDALFLLRSTRALASGQRDEFNLVEVEGNEFYIVGEIGPGIGEALIEFYLAGTLVESEAELDGFGDMGPSHESSRRACVAIPRQHPVAVRAEKWFIANGYKILPIRVCRPDFFVSKAGRKFVVEVKPDGSLQNAAMALGQLTMYSQKLGGAGKIAVFPTDHEEREATRLDRFDRTIEIIYV